MFQDCGLYYRGRFAPTDARIQGDSYHDARGPLKKEWRDGDSTWSLVSEDELEQATSKIRELEDEGWLEDYVEHHDAWRRDIGQITSPLRLPPMSLPNSLSLHRFHILLT